MKEAAARTVAEQYEGVLLDAFGVLVDSAGALPGAAELVAWLDAESRPFVVVTNDASRLPESVAAKLRRGGIEVGPDRILTSGQLLAPYFRREGLVGARCVVLGPPDSVEYVRRAGGDPVSHRAVEDGPFDVLVIGDESGYPLLEAIDDVLGPLVDAFREDRAPRLVVPNPDVVYPKPNRGLGLASGGVASIFESVLAAKVPDHPSRHFARLGKPHPDLFEVGRQRLGCNQVVMFGDTPATDLAGARAAGLDAALVLTGVTRSAEGVQPAPDWVVRSLT
jgi:HAD superfamily hydrolase (TIGR01450 family)